MLFLLYMTDINDYLPAGISTKKYADDIVAYIIGTATKTDLPARADHD